MSISTNSNTTLEFTNHEENLSYNQIKNKILSNLNKANKLLDKSSFNKLKKELISNIKSNNKFIVSINEDSTYTSYNSEKEELFGGSNVEGTTETKTSNKQHDEKTVQPEEPVKEEDEYVEETASDEESTTQSENGNKKIIDNNLSKEETVQLEEETVQSEKSNKQHDEETVQSEEPMKEEDEYVEETASDEESTTQSENGNKKIIDNNLSKEETVQLEEETVQSEKETGSSETNNKQPEEATQESNPSPLWKFFGGNTSLEDSDIEQTYMIDSDESDEESLIDKAKLTNKKYLKSLKVSDLREIMRENHMQLSKKGFYLKKNQMISKISKNFK